jgi:hypothetical protein
MLSDSVTAGAELDRRSCTVHIAAPDERSRFYQKLEDYDGMEDYRAMTPAGR